VCAHVEALESAIRHKYEADKRCLDIAEGKVNAYTDIGWYQLVEESNDDWTIVARNHKGNVVKILHIVDNPRVIHDTGTSNYDISLDSVTTDGEIISSFIASNKQAVFEHIHHIANKYHGRKLTEARGSNWNKELIDEVVSKKDIGRSSTPDLDVGIKLYLYTQDGEYDVKTVKTLSYRGTHIRSAGEYEGGIDVPVRDFCSRKYELTDDDLQRVMTAYKKKIGRMLSEKV
jgi:hypothetical protein